MNIIEALNARKTSKIIGNPQNRARVGKKERDIVDRLISAAGNAPFHYACANLHKDQFSSSAPWRAYKLDQSACHELMQHLIDNGDATKIPNMLAAAQFLIQVTWLPDEGTLLAKEPVKEGAQFEGTLRNMEHIAAASAFAQSLLLAATWAGFRTYWSSGGPLRSPAIFEKLGISYDELLIGSIFLYPNEVEDAEIKPGAMADKRGVLDDWSRWCEIT